MFSKGAAQTIQLKLICPLFNPHSFRHARKPDLGKARVRVRPTRTSQFNPPAQFTKLRRSDFRPTNYEPRDRFTHLRYGTLQSCLLAIMCG